MLDPRLIAQMQNLGNQQSAMRSGKSGTGLLDDGENNVGNATSVPPQILPIGFEFTIQRQNNPPRILNLTADTNKGQDITLVMTAARDPNQPGGSGPLTGIVEFGGGTQSTKIEFDIPIGPYLGDFTTVAPGTEPEDGGAVIQVPTSVLRAFARYDNAYLTPEIYGYAFGGPGSPSFPLPPGAGPFAPNLGFPYGSIANPNPMPPASLNVKAFTAYFGRHYSKLYKTHYLYIGNHGTPVSFTEGASPVFYIIPPFAKSVKVVPTPPVSMTIKLTDQTAWGSDSPGPFTLQEEYIIPANTYPDIPISGNDNTILVQSTGAGDKIYGSSSSTR